MTNIQETTPPKWCGEITSKTECEQSLFKKATDMTQVKRCLWDGATCAAEANFAACNMAKVCEKEVKCADLCSMTNIQTTTPKKWCGEINGKTECEQGWFKKTSDPAQVKRCVWDGATCAGGDKEATCDMTKACEKEFCPLPAGTTDYTAITKENALMHAHSFYTDLAIGGDLKDGTPNENAPLDGDVCVGGTITGRWNKNGNIKEGCKLDTLFDWADFEDLARRAVSGTYSSWIGIYKVVVLNKGGTYNTYDFRNGGQGEDNGKTLAIFRSDEDVILTKTSDGRQFGPSVLAPFARVTLKGDAGFIDGFLIAKSIGGNPGGNAGQLQMHGDGYKGKIECYKK